MTGPNQSPCEGSGRLQLGIPRGADTNVGSVLGIDVGKWLAPTGLKQTDPKRGRCHSNQRARRRDGEGTGRDGLRWVVIPVVIMEHNVGRVYFYTDSS